MKWRRSGGLVGGGGGECRLVGGGGGECGLAGLDGLGGIAGSIYWRLGKSFAVNESGVKGADIKLLTADEQSVF